MKRTAQQAGKSSLELLEEAIHLLRVAPASAWAAYYLGTLPFVLGFLFFWADMSRSPFAQQHLADAALGMAGLFVLMKFCHGLFVRELRRALGGSAPPRGWRAWARLLLVQTALQPTGLFLLPLALVVVAPFAWLCAVYQNLTVVADSDGVKFRELVKRSLRQASLWPRQNHGLVAILLAFAFFVFLNWSTVCLFLPNLVKMLFGVESVFTRSGTSLLNTTFFAAMFWLTYVCVDPVFKAAYLLRCFYGESLQSGQDLKAELKTLKLSAAGAVAMLLVWLCAATAVASPGRAAEDATGTPGPAASSPARSGPGVAGKPAGLEPRDLDQAIREVVRQRKYTWRMPREKNAEPPAGQPSIFERFLERVQETVARFFKTLGNWLDQLLRRLFQGHRRTSTGGYGYSWMVVQQLLLDLLVIAAAAGLFFLLYRFWRERQHRAQSVAAEPLQSVPDLADENVGPEDLPEDGWTRLARELLGRGEFRLALRAFYLASLAHLAQRNLLTLAKFKSNREYQRELGRRGHAFPELLTVFDENVSVFDRVWYGRHELDADLVDRFAANVERMRVGA